MLSTRNYTAAAARPRRGQRDGVSLRGRPAGPLLLAGLCARSRRAAAARAAITTVWEDSVRRNLPRASESTEGADSSMQHH